MDRDLLIETLHNLILEWADAAHDVSSEAEGIYNGCIDDLQDTLTDYQST